MREGYPRELFKKLRMRRHGIKEQYPGIYYITNNLTMQVQIIVTKDLGPEEHLFLKALSDKVNEQTARKIVETASLMDEKGDVENVEALFQISMAANKGIYDKIREEENSGLKEENKKLKLAML